MDTNNDNTNGDKLNEDWLSAYLDRELSAAEREEAERRLAASPELRRELDQLKALSEQLRGLPRDPAPGDLVDRVLARISFSSHTPSATNHSAANGQLLARPAEQNHSGINGALPSTVGDNRAGMVKPANRNHSREWTLAAISLVVSAAALVMMVRLQNFEVIPTSQTPHANSSVEVEFTDMDEGWEGLKFADRPRLVTLLAVQDVKAGIQVLERELDGSDSVGGGQSTGQAFQLEFGVANVSRTVALLDGLLDENRVAAVNQSPIEVHALGIAADPLKEQLGELTRERSVHRFNENEQKENQEARKKLSDSEQVGRGLAEKSPAQKPMASKAKGAEHKFGSSSRNGKLADGESANTFRNGKGVPSSDQMPQQPAEDGQPKVLAYYVEVPRETLMAVLNELKENEDLLDVTVGALQVPDSKPDSDANFDWAFADRPASTGNARSLHELDGDVAQPDRADDYRLTQNAVRFGLAFEATQGSQQMPVIHPSDPAAELAPIAAPAVVEKGGQVVPPAPEENRASFARRRVSPQEPAHHSKSDLAKSAKESGALPAIGQAPNRSQPAEVRDAPQAAGAKPNAGPIMAKDEGQNAASETQVQRRAANGFQQKLSLSYRYDNSGFGVVNSSPAGEEGLSQNALKNSMDGPTDRAAQSPPPSPPAPASAREKNTLAENILAEETDAPVSVLFDIQDADGRKLWSVQFGNGVGRTARDSQGPTAAPASPGDHGLFNKPGASTAAGNPGLGGSVKNAPSNLAQDKSDSIQRKNDGAVDAKKQVDRGNERSEGVSGGGGRAGGVDFSTKLRGSQIPREPAGPGATAPQQQRSVATKAEESTRYVRVLIVLRPSQSPQAANSNSAPIEPSAPKPSEPVKK